MSGCGSNGQSFHCATLHVTALTGLCGIAVSLNKHDMNLKVQGKQIHRISIITTMTTIIIIIIIIIIIQLNPFT
jgi:hypothetical protein